MVLILTGMDSEEDLDRLERGLEEVPELLGRAAIPPPPMRSGSCPPGGPVCPDGAPPSGGLRRASIRRTAGPLSPRGASGGAGERITEKELAYLREIGYNNHEVSVIL